MQPRAAWLVLGLLVAACGKVSPKDSEQDQTSSGGVAGGSSSSGGTGSMTPVDPPLELECTEETRGPGPSPLSRLSNFELNRSLRALNLQSAFDSDLRMLPDDYGFDSESPGPSEFEYHELVHDLALRFSQNEQAIQDVSQCDPASSGEASCQAQFLERFLERAYRRAVTEQDIAEMAPVFAEGRKLGGDFASGARAVVEVALQSPEFLYLLELGSGEASGDAVALTGFESASRLSYFLTGAPPDDALLEVAAKGSMSADDLEAEARRLLGTAPNRELVRHFYTQLLGLVNLREDAAQGYGPEIASLALEATGRFVEDVTFDGAGTFRALMTEPSAWVNEPLAPFYGVEGVKGDAFQKVRLDPQQRSGLFTQVAFLANSSRATEPSPIQRAMVVLRRALCYEPPPPPPGVPASPPDPVGGTLRGRLTALTQDAECQGCHQDLNPVGFAFQNYDPVGKWRDAEPQGPINASGYLRITSASGNFANAVELLQRIAESYDGDQCFASQWLTRAYRRRAEPGDGCAHEQVVQAFRDNDGKLVELLVALAKTDNFRFRLKSELAP
jgi:Protein of unknown function (DUF1588)/Protein of unknown function (DUF1592)/Protein of unknown function (DUF1595)/Protein of unknown function (DUF1585)